MIRETYERITIECSDAELPRAIAALQGNYSSDTTVYLQHDRQTEVFLSYEPRKYKEIERG